MDEDRGHDVPLSQDEIKCIYQLTENVQISGGAGIDLLASIRSKLRVLLPKDGTDGGKE